MSSFVVYRMFCKYGEWEGFLFWVAMIQDRNKTGAELNELKMKWISNYFRHVLTLYCPQYHGGVFRSVFLTKEQQKIPTTNLLVTDWAVSRNKNDIYRIFPGCNIELNQGIDKYTIKII